MRTSVLLSASGALLFLASLLLTWIGRDQQPSLALFAFAVLASLAALVIAGVLLRWRPENQHPDRTLLGVIGDTSRDAIITRDLNGCILSWNKGAENIYGYRAEEIVGRNIKQIVPTDLHEETDTLQRQITQGHFVEDKVTERIRKDGSRLRVSLSVAPLKDKSGTVVGAVAIGRDLTPLHHSEERAQAIMQASPVGMLLVDRSGILREINPAGREMFGYSDELLGESVEKLIPRSLRQKHVGFRNNYMKNPETRDMGKGRDLSAVRRDGSEFPVEIALTPLPDAGRVLASVVDITERKRAESRVEQFIGQLERSNRELDSFAYVASHDLRSPLRGIRHLAEFIEEDAGDDLPQEVHRHIAMLKGRIDRMEALLEDLLEFSRVGRSVMQLQNVSIRELFHKIVDLVDVPPGFNITLDSAVDDIETYRAPLEQVLRNLVQNAVKHHDREDGRVIVSVRYLDQTMVEFAIIDDGPGIPREYRERIFQMFTTLQPRDQVEGSGLGLSLVSKLLDQYGGQVRVDEPEQGDRGSVFCFTWPVNIDEKEMA